jgi:putative addiction module component (TIGR02574 family)
VLDLPHDGVSSDGWFARAILGKGVRMSQTLPLPPPGFDALSVEEQIEYVQSLWDHIAAQPEQVLVPDWHKRIISERLAAYRDDPNAGTQWDEFEDDLITSTKKPA